MKVLVGCLLFFPLVCGAQEFKCTEGGKTVYQQYPCQPGRHYVEPKARRSSESAPAARNVTQGQSTDDRQLTALVAGAVATRDYTKAHSLAVTTEHWSMIERAKQQDIQNAQAERDISRRNRPTVTRCTPGQYSTTCVTH